jgi:hypothetical protein
MISRVRAVAAMAVGLACTWAHVLAQGQPTPPANPATQEQSQALNAPAADVQQALTAAQQAATAGQWGQAELWLERALLLQPENAEARLLLAHLLVQRGRAAEGRLLVESLLSDPRVPPEYKPRLLSLVQGLIPLSDQGKPLEEQNSQTAKLTTNNVSVDSSVLSTPQTRGSPPAATSAPRMGRGQLEALIGRSQNPLVQTSVREVALTLPDGALVLPLLTQPRPGNVTSLRGQWEGATSWGDVGLQSHVQTVSTASLPSVRLLSWWQWSPTWGVQFQAQRLADASRRAQLGLQAVWPLSVPGIAEDTPMGGVSPTTQRHSPAAANAALVVQAGAYRELDSGRQGATARTTVLAGLGPRSQALAWVEAEDNRSGIGAPGLAGIGAAWVGQVRNNIQLQAQVLEQKDLSGYSPLLENNAPRRLKTLTAQAEWAPGGSLTSGLVLRLHGGRRTANLPLFAWEDAGFSVLWRQSF